jgi:dipeptidyl-peptidase-4
VPGVTTSAHEAPSYPRLAALTQRFSLGVPTQVAVTADGTRVLFVRSRSGTDREGLLWCLDVADGVERLLLDPAAALHGQAEQVPDEELARRERLRQGGAGVTAFALDADGSHAVVALSGRLFVLAVADGSVVEVPGAHGAVDPRLSPDGSLVAFHAHGGLHVAPADGAAPPRPLVEPDGPAVTWGLSDFAHAEELSRSRSFWWSPDSASLLVARVDETPVQQWHIADPAHPDRRPQVVRYPAAGTANVSTSLWHVGLDGERTEVVWDHEALPYLVDVGWGPATPALVTVLARTQQRLQVLAWEPGQQPRLVRALDDPAWVDVVPGVPAWWEGRLLTVEVDRAADAYRLCVEGTPVSPPTAQVRAVLDAGRDGVLVVAAHDPGERRLARLLADTWTWLTPEGAAASGAAGGGTVLARVDAPDALRPDVHVLEGPPLAVHSEDLPWLPAPRLLPRSRPDDPRVAVLEPQARSGRPLPVLLDPYGGPHGLSVAGPARAYLESQWWADQGYLVVVADGPGTPGSPAWERAMAGNMAGPALAAQVRALEMVAAEYGERADRSRVAIRGWSFGGYLAALLLLERPDLVHAAVAGAPVTDWTLYDTAYTERYLGLPAEHPDRYREQSLLERAPRLRRPLLIVHGLADDNVVVAHTLTFSRALLAAGRGHRVLPLSGVTHMTPQAVVAENLLLLQRDFLAEALGPGSPAADRAD